MTSIAVNPNRRDRRGPQDLSPGAELAEISRQLDVVSNGVKTSGNTLQPFIDGENAFPRLLKSLGAAKRSITYETFAFLGKDTTSTQIADALIAAKQRGVDVKVLADAVGSRNFFFLQNPNLKRLQAAGVAVELYSPLRSVKQLDFHRDHRKTVVVDGKVGWVGGMNSGDIYMGPPEVKGRLHDVFARVQGAAVDALISDFADSWAHVNDLASAKAAVAPVQVAKGGTQVRIVEHTPKQDTNIRNTYLTLINDAQKNIYLENKFPLSTEMASALAAAAKRGVDVHYIVSLKGALGLLTQSRFPALLRAGVHIHVFPDSIHTKAMSVDGLVSTLGSSNVDNISLLRNREIIAVMEDPAFTQRFDRALFQRDMVADHQGKPTRTVTSGPGFFPKFAGWLLSHLLPGSDQ